MSRALLLGLAFVGAAGPAAAATRDYQVSDFTRVRVEGSFDVRVRTGVAPGARATGPQPLIDRVIVEQHGDTLVVRPDRHAGFDNWRWNGNDRLIVEVATHRLDAAALSGSGDVAIDRVQGDAFDLSLGGSGDLSVGDLRVGALKVAANGSGNIDVKGRADHADLLLIGPGDIRAAAFTADEATVKLVGSGNVALAARRTATVTSNGSGDVTVTGPAACTVNRTGSGDVRCGGVRDGD